MNLIDTNCLIFCKQRIMGVEWCLANNGEAASSSEVGFMSLSFFRYFVNFNFGEKIVGLIIMTGNNRSHMIRC